MKRLKYHTRATEAIDILRRKHNFEAYIVGGAVRDLLMDKTTEDNLQSYQTYGNIESAVEKIMQ